MKRWLTSPKSLSLNRLRRSWVSSVLSPLFLRVQVQKCPLTKAEDIMDGATATVPTVLLTTATDMADGIMVMTMYMAVNLGAIKVVAASINREPLCSQRRRNWKAILMKA